MINDSTMKPFSFEEYIKCPFRKVVTREGRPARVICAYAKGDQPVVALVDIDGNELSFSYYENGRCSKEETPADLFFDDTSEGWVNVYRDSFGRLYTDRTIYRTKEEAKDLNNLHNYIGAFRIDLNINNNNK